MLTISQPKSRESLQLESYQLQVDITPQLFYSSLTLASSLELKINREWNSGT